MKIVPWHYYGWMSSMILTLDASLFLGATFALSAALFWGFGSLFVKVSVGSMSYLKGMVLRAMLAFPSLVFITLVYASLVEQLDLFAPLAPSVGWITVLSTIVLLMGDVCFLIAMSKADVSFSYPIASSYPFFAAVYLYILNLEEFTEPIVIGTVLVVFGVIAVSRVQQHDTAQVSDKRESSKPLAFLFAVLAAAFWGMAVTTLKMILATGVHPLALNVHRIWIILLVAFTVGLIFDRFDNGLKEELGVNLRTLFDDKKRSLMMGISGILAWAFGGSVFLVSIDMIGANRATPISAITPLVGSILGVLFLKEKWSIWHVTGLLLIVIGSVFLVMV